MCCILFKIDELIIYDDTCRLEYDVFLVAFTDRSRSGCYNIRNVDYFNRKPCWFPSGFDQGEFNGIPENIHVEPEDGRDPDQYIIKIPGNRKSMKLNEGATVTINGQVIEFLEKYRVIKDIRFGTLGRFLVIIFSRTMNHCLLHKL